MQSWLFFGAALTFVVAAAWLRGRRGRQPLVAVLIAAAGSLVAVWAVVDAYDLRKLVGACVMPAGLVWLGLALLARRLVAKGQGRLATVAFLLWLGMGLAGNVWVGHALMGWLEQNYDRVDPLTLEPFDAVVVLGGGIDQHPNGQVSLSDAGDRVVLAARMFHLGRARVLVTSGPLLPVGEPPTTSIPRLTARVWQEMGVPAEAVVLLEGPTATRDEVAAFARLLAGRRWQRVGLITSAFHLRRATRLCRRAGLAVTPLPADLQATILAPRPAHLVPQSDGFATVQAACWELLGAAVGR